MSDKEKIAKYNKQGDEWKLTTGLKYLFEFNPFPPRYVLEIEDIHFHHNSSVIMPYYITDDENDDIQRGEQISGLAVLRACYLHAKEHNSRKLLIAGHTDTTGSKSYNAKLSKMRSDNILYLLTGRKNKWVNSVLKKHKVEDYQQILKWCELCFGWRCDPGKIDNKLGKMTKRAVEIFQTGYNHEFEASISVDGVIGRQTWGAFFDVIINELSLILETDQKNMARFRDYLNFVDESDQSVGCGEYYPIAQGHKDNYRSQLNRRVELLFFETGQEPNLKCHSVGPECDYKVCTVYKNRKPEYIEVKPCPQFLWIDLHTIDEFGYIIPRVSLQLKPEYGKPKTITTNSKGYWKGRVRGDGSIKVYMPDGKSPVYFGASPQKKDEDASQKTATINPKLAAKTTDEIVVPTSAITEEQKKSRMAIVRRYGRMASDSRKSIRSGNSGEREGEKAHKIHGRGYKPKKNEVERYTKRYWGQLSADNLYIASGMDRAKFVSILNQWLRGCHSTAHSRGYIMNFIYGDKLFVFLSGNLEKYWEFTISSNWKIASPYGAYTPFEYLEYMCLDMNSECYFLSAKPKSQSKKGEDKENASESNGNDKNEPFYIYNILTTEQQKAEYEKKVLPKLSGRAELYYHYPSDEVGWFLARHGGTGLLENYPRNNEIRKDVNKRNLSVVKNCKLSYEAYIKSYIKKVDDIKFDTEAEKNLHSLGPPEDQFKFPRPVGCTDKEWVEIIKAQSSNQCFFAYKAISNKLCDIYGVRGDGDIWLKFEVEVDTGEYLGKIIDVKFKRNWETMRDGRIKRVNDEITGSLKYPGKNATGNISVTVDPKTGAVQQKVSYGLGKYGFEYNLTTGTAKASVYGIASVEANAEVKQIGYGAQVSTRDLYKLYLKHVRRMGSKDIDKLANKVPAVTLGFGIQFQLLREATVLAYLMSTRGFFERRPISELTELDWASLDYYEHSYLKVLGWHEEIEKIDRLKAMLKYYPKNTIIWDVKRLIPYSHYPESAKNKWLKLTHPQKRASLDLIGATLACEGNWRGFWKNLAPKTSKPSNKA